MVEVGLYSAFTAGILSFFSPCILPIIPVYISLMSNKAVFKGNSMKFSDRMFLLLNSTFFVLGFSLIFVALGSTATLVGQALKNYSNIISRIGGVVLIIFGLHYMGVFNIPFLNVEKKFRIPDSLRVSYYFYYLRSFFSGSGNNIHY